MPFRPFLFGFHVPVLHLSPHIKPDDLRETGRAISITVCGVDCTSCHKNASSPSLPARPSHSRFQVNWNNTSAAKQQKPVHPLQVPPARFPPPRLCFIDSSKPTAFRQEHLTFCRISLCSIFLSIRKEMKASRGCFCTAAVAASRCALPSLYVF